MPKYSYRCLKCENVFDIYHSMNDKKTDCMLCQEEGFLIKTPSKFVLYKPEDKEGVKVGSVVRGSIEEFKKELDQEKEKLRNELFEPDK